MFPPARWRAAPSAVYWLAPVKENPVPGRGQCLANTKDLEPQTRLWACTAKNLLLVHQPKLSGPSCRSCLKVGVLGSCIQRRSRIPHPSLGLAELSTRHCIPKIPHARTSVHPVSLEGTLSSVHHTLQRPFILNRLHRHQSHHHQLQTTNPPPAELPLQPVAVFSRSRPWQPTTDYEPPRPEMRSVDQGCASRYECSWHSWCSSAA